MSHADATAAAAACPGAELTHPFGPGVDIWKVRGKMFAALDPRDGSATFKCPSPDVAEMLIEIGVVHRARYLTRGGWVTAEAGALEPADLAARIAASHAAVVAGLPKALRAGLADGG